MEKSPKGVASAKNYGVRVHAGKTVYVDSMSVAQGSGATTTLYVKNSGTGAANFDVESALTTGGTVTFSSLTGCANGLIAQDVASVAPELVFTMGDGTMGVKYDKAVGLIIEAIKQLASSASAQRAQQTAGVAKIPVSETHVDVRFRELFRAPPVISLSLYIQSATDSAFLTESGRVAVTEVTKDGFTIVREPLPRDVIYMWTATVNDIENTIVIPTVILTPTITPTPTPVEPVIPEASPSGNTGTGA